MTSAIDVINDLELTDEHEQLEVMKDLLDKEIIYFTVNHHSCYESSTLLIARDSGGNWYSYEASHCSCSSYSGTWDLARDHVEHLLSRAYYSFNKEEIITAIKKELEARP